MTATCAGAHTTATCAVIVSSWSTVRAQISATVCWPGCCCSCSRLFQSTAVPRVSIFRRDHPRTDRARASRRYGRVHADQSGIDSALNGLPRHAHRSQDGVSICAARPVRVVHVSATLRGGIPVSLRDGARADAHWLRHVRGDRGRSRTPLPPAHEFVLVQNEYYLGQPVNGVSPFDYQKMLGHCPTSWPSTGGRTNIRASHYTCHTAPASGSTSSRLARIIRARFISSGAVRHSVPRVASRQRDTWRPDVRRFAGRGYDLRADR